MKIKSKELASLWAIAKQAAEKFGNSPQHFYRVLRGETSTNLLSVEECAYISKELESIAASAHELGEAFGSIQ